MSCSYNHRNIADTPADSKLTRKVSWLYPTTSGHIVVLSESCGYTKDTFPIFPNSQNKKKNTLQSGWLFDKYVSYTKIGFRPSLWWECFLIAVSKNAISPKRLPLAYVSCVSKSTFRQILWDGWSRNVQSKNTTSPKRLTSIYVSCLPKSTFRPILWGKCFGNV